MTSTTVLVFPILSTIHIGLLARPRHQIHKYSTQKCKDQAQISGPDFYFSKQHSRHGPVVDPERVGHVEENTALTTDVLLVRAGATGAGSPVHGGGVSTARGRGVSPQSDVTVLAPSGAPEVQVN